MSVLVKGIDKPDRCLYCFMRMQCSRYSTWLKDARSCTAPHPDEDCPIEELPATKPNEESIPLSWIQEYAEDWPDMNYAYENPILGMLEEWDEVSK